MVQKDIFWGPITEQGTDQLAVGHDTLQIEQVDNLSRVLAQQLMFNSSVIELKSHAGRGSF